MKALRAAKSIAEAMAIGGPCIVLAFLDEIVDTLGEVPAAGLLFGFVAAVLGVPALVNRIEHRAWQRDFDARWRALDAEAPSRGRQA